VTWREGEVARRSAKRGEKETRARRRATKREVTIGEKRGPGGENLYSDGTIGEKERRVYSPSRLSD
jgi:hypothetical protein